MKMHVFTNSYSILLCLIIDTFYFTFPLLTIDGCIVVYKINMLCMLVTLGRSMMQDKEYSPVPL